MQTEPKQTNLLAVPDKIEVNENFSKLTISYRWLNSYSYFLLIGMFLIFTIVITTLRDSFVFDGTSLFKELSDTPTLVLLVMAMFAITGIYYAYYALCSVLNKTIVEVDGHAINIWFEPLPWIGSDKILRADIKQLYTIQHVKARDNRINLSISYRVKAVTQSNRSIILVQDITTAEQARFLERKIEQYLGITNEKVEGEYVEGIQEPNAWFGDWHL